MDQVEVFEDIWQNQTDEWLVYVKSNVLCFSLSFARYIKVMEEIKGFGNKNILT